MGSGFFGESVGGLPWGKGSWDGEERGELNFAPRVECEGDFTSRVRVVCSSSGLIFDG